MHEPIIMKISKSLLAYNVLPIKNVAISDVSLKIDTM